MATYKGIDVSEYQGKIDWQAVRRAGVTFAMLRAGYGRYADQVDKRFEENYAGASKAGVHVGAYWFSYAVTPEQARSEAETCLLHLAGKRFDYPIAYDVETRAHRELGEEKLSAVVQAFCETLEAHGYYVCVYANLSFLRSVLSSYIRTRYCIWLAQWASTPTYGGSFGMWQHSASGTVPGISGAVDLDLSYKDFPAVMRENGLNGYGAADVEPVYPGKAVTLEREKLYISASASVAAARVSGTYYIYSVPAVRGRYRITNRLSRVEKKPEWLNVTGWIDAAAAEGRAGDRAEFGIRSSEFGIYPASQA